MGLVEKSVPPLILGEDSRSSVQLLLPFYNPSHQPPHTFQAIEKKRASILLTDVSVEKKRASILLTDVSVLSSTAFYVV